jgi:hypothetical protein
MPAMPITTRVWTTAKPASVLRFGAPRLIAASCCELAHDVGDAEGGQRGTCAQDRIPRGSGNGAEHLDGIVIEGQGALSHPAYLSSVFIL